MVMVTVTAMATVIEKIPENGIQLKNFFSRTVTEVAKLCSEC